ncbi:MULTISPECIES: hypothetical protein [Lactococcus]|jgi:hypothetical protein|uniref:Uncharacterized protein n=1 Tax=Lactococcus formosensis TaxID=1281486 RepID=A0A9Q9D7M4_9LACT|nr:MULTISPECIES: hypothetical protein [Lactococcus]USI66558.1 hypothetical protein LMK05_04575 [Lactococcus petauri]USI69000.1 hypothetical protein LMK04_04495 [Lactococcus petauri]USJ21189.1 hypothetical protein LMK00_04080 [Lactococcus formosensis]WJE13669.1 hypothetical protein QR692_04475 [Lactococcus petauri]
MSKLKLLSSYKQYYVYDKEGNFVDCGSYYCLLHRLNLNQTTFKTSLHKFKKGIKSSEYIIEEFKREELKDLGLFYDLLITLNPTDVNPLIVNEVRLKSDQHHFADTLNNGENSSTSQLSLISELYKTSNRTAQKFVVLAYAALQASEFSLYEETAQFYDLPLWLVEFVGENLEKIFKK